MSCLRPFKSLRPRADLASQVASPPYDVLSSDEAREMAGENPWSFLRINKSEIDLPLGTNLYSDEVYARAKENLKTFREKEVLIEDQTPCLYLYTLVDGEHRQTGIAGCFSAQEYLDNQIRKHEYTRRDKEEDRTRHIDETNAQTGIVLLTFKSHPRVNEMIKAILNREPLYDFTASDGIRHIVHQITDQGEVSNLVDYFKEINPLYIADGHHRSAGASIVYNRRRQANPNHQGNEEYNFFLAVAFPDDQLRILPYNRVLKDLNGMSKEELLEKLGKIFSIEPTSVKSPQKPKTISLYLDGQWYGLTYLKTPSSDPLERLDVAILQNEVLSPLFGIEDPKNDKRIDFVGGTRGTDELEKLVDSGAFKLAFSMFPTSIGDLMAVAEDNKIMPPKSTWFAPKLRDGLLVHLLD